MSRIVSQEVNMTVLVFVEESFPLTEAEILEETNRRKVLVIDPAHCRATIDVPELQGLEHVAFASEFFSGVRTVSPEVGLSFEFDLAILECTDYPIIDNDDLAFGSFVQGRSVKESFRFGFFQKSRILFEMRQFYFAVVRTND
jgi:hypothetical protein